VIGKNLKTEMILIQVFSVRLKSEKQNNNQWVVDRMIPIGGQVVWLYYRLEGGVSGCNAGNLAVP
jgi:hypothetical protein